MFEALAKWHDTSHMMINSTSFGTVWAETLKMMIASRDVPGLIRGCNPKLDLSWMACGYNQLMRVYPEEQWFQNFIKEDLRAKGSRVLSKLRQLRAISDVNSHMHIKVLDMFLAFTDKVEAGVLLHGPLLGYAYVKEHELYMYIQEGMEPYTLPRYSANSGQDYPYTEHVDVAMEALQEMCMNFGVWDFAPQDVRGQTALRPLESYKDSNSRLINHHFARVAVDKLALPEGVVATYSLPDFIERKKFRVQNMEEMSLSVQAFFLKEEAITWWMQAKLHFMMAITHEDGQLQLFKLPIIAHDSPMEVGRVQRRTMFLNSMDNYELQAAITMPHEGRDVALILHLEKPGTMGQNPMKLHLIRLSTVPATVEAKMSVQGTESVRVSRWTDQEWMQWRASRR